MRYDEDYLYQGLVAPQADQRYPLPRPTTLRALHAGVTRTQVPFPDLNSGHFTRGRRPGKSGSGADVCRYKWTNPDSESPEPQEVVVKQISWTDRAVQVNQNVVQVRGVLTNLDRLQDDYIAYLLQGSLPGVTTMKCEEDSLTELGVYMRLWRGERARGCEHIVRMLDIFKDTGNNAIWLVLEPCGPSLHEHVVTSKSNEEFVAEADLRHWTEQLMRAVLCLHGLNIAHRDISLQNLLLSRDDQLKLIDFGMACLLRDDLGNAFRYFRPAGKDYYSAPEMYLPAPDKWPNRCFWLQGEHPPGPVARAAQRRLGKQMLFAVESTGHVDAGRTLVWLKGYEAGPADIFACGVCVFILHVQLPPWRKAHTEDEGFVCFESNATKGLNCMKILLTKKYIPQNQVPPLSDRACDFVNLLLSPAPEARPTVQDAVNHPFLLQQDF
eukprot:TRINITY_DN14847_c0_g1_i1.p1 TRINITY_DN14847_c0_g1~~TRINITY_DN14847_c0_g1_i1.p1  ORF type:complete len:439 (+),score=27.10 TRINITY_DN14847_c0_g1_i1:134-1450(+)